MQIKAYNSDLRNVSGCTAETFVYMLFNIFTQIIVFLMTTIPEL